MPGGGTLTGGHDGDAKGTRDSRGAGRIGADVASTTAGVEPAASEAAASIASAQGVSLSDEQKADLERLKQGLTSDDATALEKAVQATRWPNSADIDRAFECFSHIYPADRVGVARMFAREVNSGKTVSHLSRMLGYMDREMIHELYSQKPTEAQLRVESDGNNVNVSLLRSCGATFLTLPTLAAREATKTAASIIGIWANLLTTGEVGKSGTMSSLITGAASVAAALTALLDKGATKAAGEVFNIDFVDGKSPPKAQQKPKPKAGPSIREQEEARRKEENRNLSVAYDGEVDRMGYGVEGGVGGPTGDDGANDGIGIL